MGFRPPGNGYVSNRKAASPGMGTRVSVDVGAFSVTKP
jgi:hypothetical protein